MSFTDNYKLHPQAIFDEDNTDPAGSVGYVLTIKTDDPRTYDFEASGGGGGAVDSVAAGNATITIGGTAADPTVAVTPGTFDAAGAAATVPVITPAGGTLTIHGTANIDYISIGGGQQFGTPSDPTDITPKGYVDTAVATAIPKTIVDAAGDLITATADNTPSRLATGLTNSTLQSNGSGQALVYRNNPIPRAQTLTDAATILFNSSNGSRFLVVLTAARTLGNDSNPSISAAQGLGFILAVQGAFLLTLGSGYNNPNFTITAVASGKTDYFGFIYNTTIAKWDLVSYMKGY